MRTCPGCGEQVAERAKFCPECGESLAPRPAPREERKVVTVVFCDLVGSTAKAEQLDPEDVRALLSSYHERVRAELERFGGTVEKFIGDAVMAVFGAPVTHEDDPERAVRAALAVRDAANQDGAFQVRVAVHTGEALVAVDARPAEGEAMVAGDVVNTAARLQSAAPENGVLVGEQTYRATERVIEYREHEPVPAKGKAEPVRAWEAVQARSRFGVDLAGASGAPLIGRDRELGLLTAAFERVKAERAPQLITLVGVPGIGKSRLLAELFSEIDRADELVTWRQGRSLPYGDGVSYWALGEMVKAQAGVLETDEPPEAEAKLRAAVERLIADAADTEWVHGHLRALAGVAAAEAVADRRGEAFAAWRRFFEALADERPLVLVFEDLHWADEGLLDFVDYLVDWLTDVPALVVATARPELLARRPAWGGGKPNATTVSLSPLSNDETAKLVHALLEQSVLPADVQSTLLERAGGNPLYAEEFVRMVAERGGGDVELPDSVHGLIAARLDTLDVVDKELLQDAAVVGKVFWSSALAAIGGRERFGIEERLHALERRELVRRARRSSLAGESEYAFAHALVRDVAYAAIPRAARAERHRRAAEWIESLGRPEDHADLLAHHYLSALELSRAAGVDVAVLASSAARAFRWAGDRAFALNAFESAARFYDEALELVVPDEDRPRVVFRLATSLHHIADDRQFEALDAARDAALAVGDRDTAAEVCLLLAEATWHRGDTDAARRELSRAQELVDGEGATPAAARVLADVARYAMLAGRSEEAVRTAGEAIAMAEQLGLEEVAVQALIARGPARGVEGIPDLEEAIRRGLAANLPDTARAYNNLASVVSDLGDPERVRRLWTEGKEVAERLGHLHARRFMTSQMMDLDFVEGRWDDAFAAAKEFIEECRTQPHYNESAAHALCAEVLLARDRVTEAEAAAARAIELARAGGDAQVLLPALSLQLRFATELRRQREARATAHELLAVLAQTDLYFGLYQLARNQAELRIEHEVGAAIARLAKTPWMTLTAAVHERDLERAADVAAELRLRNIEAELRVDAAAELVAAGRRADADRNLASALAFFREAGAPRYVRKAEALLAKTA